MRKLIQRLEKNRILEKDEFTFLIENFDDEIKEYAAKKAREISSAYFSNNIYIRGLIEFTNYCKNNCIYCGIRRDNQNAERYRLSRQEILACCLEGYELGFRTFVLQGGEDPHFTDERILDLIKAIKEGYPDCALTLSIGEKSKESYQKYYEAGADRYLLRHETSGEEHYRKLHPAEMTLQSRKQCLSDLKEIGFQTGCGFMVGAPGQTPSTLAGDLLFIHELDPQMVGIGPFIPHKETPFAGEKQGSLELTLFMLSLIRIMQRNVLLPATTALGTIAPDGRERGILAGANVVMPNLSPCVVRSKYSLYDNKICTGEESAQCIACLSHRVESIGYRIEQGRGDYV